MHCYLNICLVLSFFEFLKVNSEVFKITGLFVGGSFALWQYYTQNAFNRAKNLDDLWRRFYENPDFVELFAIMDNIANNQNIDIEIKKLKEYPSKEKLKFLAFLAENIIYFKMNIFSAKKIDKKNVKMLFQWHFHYAFTHVKTKYCFWYNLVEHSQGNNSGIMDEEIHRNIDAEINQNYWKRYYHFAKECEKLIENTAKNI